MTLRIEHIKSVLLNTLLPDHGIYAERPDVRDSLRDVVYDKTVYYVDIIYEAHLACYRTECTT